MNARGLRRGALLACLVVGFAASARGDVPCVARAGGDDGIGGTGFGGDDGIGGTGFGGDDDSGIGGTGIYGVITGLGSICVNGLHLATPDDLPVTRDGEPASAADLAVGRVVWASATMRDDQLVATAVAIETAVRGSVAAVFPDARRLAVAGIEIDLGDIAPQEFAIGDPIEVSGLWRDERSVVATRIDRVAPAPDRVRRPDDLPRRTRGKRWISIEGFIADAKRDGGFAVSGVPVEGRAPEPGTRVWVRGRLTEAGRIAPERIDTRPEPHAPSARRDPPRARPETAPRVERPERPPTIDRIDRPPKIDRVERIERPAIQDVR